MKPRCVETEDGCRLLVRDWGASVNGGPVVFLAGWGMDSRIWQETMMGLNQQGLRTVAYDRRGHGGSDDAELLDYDQLADDLATVLDGLDLKAATLVAHSGGAGEAIRYLARYGRARVQRLVLVSAVGPCMLAGSDNPGGIPAEGFEALLEQLTWELPKWVDENSRPFAPTASDRQLDWLGSMVLSASRRAIVDFQRIIATTDLRETFEGLDLPITVIHGDLDVSAPYDLCAGRYLELAQNGELLVYQGHAHGLVITAARRLADDIGERARAH